VFVDLGQTALLDRRWTEAVAASRRAARIDPEWNGAHTAWGDALTGRPDHTVRDDEAAILHYKRAIELDTKVSEAAPWRGWAKVLLNQGRGLEAIALIRSAIIVHAKADAEAMYHEQLGNFLYDMGCQAQGRFEYQRAVETDSDVVDVEHLLERGVALCSVPISDSLVECRECAPSTDVETSGGGNLQRNWPLGATGWPGRHHHPPGRRRH
jgi:tetratricopeptide (TPR) repeat protein